MIRSGSPADESERYPVCPGGITTEIEESTEKRDLEKARYTSGRAAREAECATGRDGGSAAGAVTE